MAISSSPSHLHLISLFIFLLSFPLLSFAEIRSSEIHLDSRSIIAFDKFGFTHTGHLELNVSGISITSTNPDPDLSLIGFFLSTRDSWIHVLQQIQDTEIICALQSNLVKVITKFDSLHGDTSFETLFPVPEANQFTLVFANCLPQVQVSMTVRSNKFSIHFDKYKNY
eukprot:TRINITY_DN1155_c0_g1_i2.p1 TRINITY_DN1155_c0_g1~~TRINITY_DN1155_c0_g1_i2.p1  ORF type:complete len:168 (+),score=4.08 TRINITY_DN1155_c0_g1_i2:165-668(+)